MNILFFTHYDVSPQKGGTERITDSLVGYLSNTHTCFSMYTWDIDTKLNKTIFCDKERLSQKNSIRQIKQFVEKNKIDLIIIQGAFDKVKVFKNAIKNNPSCKIISVHHYNPGAETNFFTFERIKKQFVVSKSISEKIKSLIKLSIHPIFFLKQAIDNKKHYKKAYDNADRLVLLSKHFIDDFKTYAGLTETRKISVIPNALSFNDFLPVEELNRKKKEVLIVSRLEEYQKRISLALKIWSVIEKKAVFTDWKLVILGDGDNKKDYLSLANKLNLKQVKFEGVKNPLEYYKKASVFMMTSSFEGWGLTLTESQQMGVVPIAFDTYKSLQDIISDGTDGYIVQEGNVDEYVEKLSHIMSNSQERNKMAINAIESSKRFEQNKIGLQWEKLFEKLNF